jgi:hypothetical protein
MIQGFNTETKPLSDYEQNTLCPIIARGLSNKYGKANAITNKNICQAMMKAGYEISDARLRKIINHIRISGMVKCVIATSSGYYIAQTKSEMKIYLDSLVGREQAIAAVRESLEQQMEAMAV